MWNFTFIVRLDWTWSILKPLQVNPSLKVGSDRERDSKDRRRNKWVAHNWQETEIPQGAKLSGWKIIFHILVSTFTYNMVRTRTRPWQCQHMISWPSIRATTTTSKQLHSLHFINNWSNAIRMSLIRWKIDTKRSAV